MQPAGRTNSLSRGHPRAGDPYVFNTLGALGNATDKMMAAEILQRWASFARGGNPEGRQQNRLGPSWPKYKRESDQHLEFGDKICVETGLDREACVFLSRAMQNRGAL